MTKGGGGEGGREVLQAPRSSAELLREVNSSSFLAKQQTDNGRKPKGKEKRHDKREIYLCRKGLGEGASKAIVPGGRGEGQEEDNGGPVTESEGSCPR